jgi:hypothetical protein
MQLAHLKFVANPLTVTRCRSGSTRGLVLVCGSFRLLEGLVHNDARFICILEASTRVFLRRVFEEVEHVHPFGELAGYQYLSHLVHQ